MSFKILYAATNRAGSKLQLFRFLQHIQQYDIELKIAGYRKMSMHLDWTLDALYDIINQNIISVIDNPNFDIYCQQIKSYNPDLIISDLEPFTSYAGQYLNIATWNVSPMLLSTIIIPLTYLNRNDYRILFKKLDGELYQNILTNANQNFVYSFLCDFANPPPLTNDYKWIRPYHYLGRESKPCSHNMVAAIHKRDRKLDQLLMQEDVVSFADPIHKYPNTKNIYSVDEYACNIKNATYCVNQGLTDTIADVLYNNKCPIIIPDLVEPEVALNVLYLEQNDIGYVSYDGKINYSKLKENNLVHNENVKFLHQHLEDLIY